MATAGRILIMPKGAWDPTVKYEMLDLVSHGGKAWLAKKTSVGIEPTFDAADYWHPILGVDGSFITESDFEAFKNETNEILEKTYTTDNPPTAEQVGAVPLTGGILSGDVGVKNATANRTASLSESGAGYAVLYNEANSNNFSALYLQDETTTVRNLLRARTNKNGTSTYYTIFGEQNKPYGSYIGNGSATSRTINTGGVGNELMVWSANGCAIVTRIGAITLSGGTIKGLTYGEAHYMDGVLTLATTNNILNANGTATYYECK